MTELTEAQRKVMAQELGRRGGKKTFGTYGADHYRKMQAKGIATKLRNKAKLQRTTSK